MYQSVMETRNRVDELVVAIESHNNEKECMYSIRCISPTGQSKVLVDKASMVSGVKVKRCWVFRW